MTGRPQAPDLFSWACSDSAGQSNSAVRAELAKRTLRFREHFVAGEECLPCLLSTDAMLYVLASRQCWRLCIINLRTGADMLRKMQTTVSDYFELRFLPRNLKLSDSAAQNYRMAIRQLNSWNGCPVKLNDLSEALITGFMRSLKKDGRTDRTANNKRQELLTIWRHAAEAKLAPAVPKIAKFEEPSRIVQAWDMNELSRILDAVSVSPTVRGWGPKQRKALVLVIYDTSHRLGALLQADTSALNLEAGTLLLKAEWTKQRADTLHKLHPDTVAALRDMLQNTARTVCPKLFQLPFRKRAIWPDIREVLKSAGLPATRRDLFHKLRRTSFTYCYAMLGERAAQEHAGHRSNCTSAYLDVGLLKKIQQAPSAIDVMPRPTS